MRSTIIAAAFAATALAVPYANPDVVTAYDTDVVYVTNVVTVTAGGEAAPTTAAAETTVAAADAAPPSYDQGGNWGGNNGGWHWPHKHHSKSKKTRTKTQTTQAPAAPSPPPSYETTTWEAPAPEPTTEAPEPQPTVVTGYNNIVVAHHNVHRRNHTAPNVEWDDALASTAQKIAASCVYAHDVEMDGGGYGQNIAAGVEAGNVSAIITNLFYNGEIGYYGNMYGSEPSMDLFEKWGHFSQIVWKGTKTVGCATQYCPNGLGNTGSNVAPYFTVCNYGPPGNYGGEYAANVLAPQGEATVDWNYDL